ncbi:hypothetical protein ES703_85341 [subsurface metagenome]
MIDDVLYPNQAVLGSQEHLYGVKGTEALVELVNAQIREQVENMVDEKLELVQIDRASTAAKEVRSYYCFDCDEEGEGLPGALEHLTHSRQGVVLFSEE